MKQPPGTHEFFPTPLLAQLSPGGRIRAILDARELVLGLIRDRPHRQCSDLSLRELNLKVL
jgi:hypothetical protein